MVPPPIQRLVYRAYNKGAGVGTPKHDEALAKAVEAVKAEAIRRQEECREGH
jgi:hypothetical protein